MDGWLLLLPMARAQCEDPKMTNSGFPCHSHCDAITLAGMGGEGTIPL